jgi:hypothetical protein
MTDHLEAYIRDAAWPVDGGHRPLQRAALREVLKLSTDAVAPAESQIVDRYERRRKQIEDDYRKTTAEIERHFGDLREQADNQYHQTKHKVENKYKEDSRRLATNTQSAKQKILWETETNREDARKRYEENTWMPREIATATKKKYKDKHDAVVRAAPGKRQQLNDLREYADWILQVYRYQPPEEAPDKASDVFENEVNDAAFEPLFETADQSLDRLRELRGPKLFSGATPFVLVMLLCGAAVAVPGVLFGMGIIDRALFTLIAPVAGGGTLLMLLISGIIIWKNSRRTIQGLHDQFVHALETAYRVIDRQLEKSTAEMKQGIAEADRQRDAEIIPLKEHYQRTLADLDQRHQESIKQLENARETATRELESRHDKAMQNLETNHGHSLEEIRRRHEKAVTEAREKYEHESTLCRPNGGEPGWNASPLCGRIPNHCTGCPPSIFPTQNSTSGRRRARIRRSCLSAGGKSIRIDWLTVSASWPVICCPPMRVLKSPPFCAFPINARCCCRPVRKAALKPFACCVPPCCACWCRNRRAGCVSPLSTRSAWAKTSPASCTWPTSTKPWSGGASGPKAATSNSS